MAKENTSLSTDVTERPPVNVSSFNRTGENKINGGSNNPENTSYTGAYRNEQWPPSRAELQERLNRL